MPTACVGSMSLTFLAKARRRARERALGRPAHSMLASSRRNTSSRWRGEEMQQIAAAMFLCAWGAAAEPAVEIQPPLPRRVLGEKFRSALDRKITATWKSVSLRSILHAIARERELAILLDRRIDPGRELPWEFSGRDLHTELAALSRGHGAPFSVA